MDEEEIDFRKRFLELTKKDEEVLKKIGEVLDKHADEIIEAFYEHLLKFPETRAFFKDEETSKKVKSFQKAYFRRLTKGGYNKNYFENRLKVGEVHDRVKLPLNLYIGSYNKYYQTVIPMICKELGYRDCRAILPLASFIKIILVDMTLAIDAYIASREVSIKASAAHYRGLVESAPSAIISATEQDTIATWNSAAERIFGYTEEEAVGKPITLIISEDARQLHEKGFRNFIKNRGILKRTFESEGLTKNGRTMPVEISLYAEMGASGYTCTAIISDITERKKAEEALRKSEAGLADAQRIAHLGNWDWDIINNELRWSDEIYRIFGLKPQEFGATYEAFLNSVHPDDREFVKRSVDEALYEGKPYSIDHRIVLPDGAERIVHEEGEVTFDERGKPIRMLGVVQDITERKRAEEALQESEERYRQLVELSPDAIVVHSKGKLVFVNPSAIKLIGATNADELIGKSAIDFVHPDYKETAKERIRQIIEEKKKMPPIEEKFIRLDGQVIDVEVAASLITYQGKPAVQVVVRDITERKKAEEEIKKRVEELEEFHRITVGRELKMIELEKEIERLKEELKRAK